MIASAGKLLATGPRFSFADCHVTSCQLDIDAIRMSRGRVNSFRPTAPADTHNIVDAEFAFPALKPQRLVQQHFGWESSPAIKEEEFTRAVSLALFDYLRKSRSHGFVVSLSGGADSAGRFAARGTVGRVRTRRTGREALLARLNYIRGLEQATDGKAIVRRLLTCVYQATRNSGDVTRNAAQTVAECHRRGISGVRCRYDRAGLYRMSYREAIGRELTWRRDDIALQNIQARVRSPSVWMLANLRNALLLSTSNRSEAAVGYATMDGDTCGGLSPIAGIDKAFLRRWLRWLENDGPARLGPLPALAAVNEQQPTAELRPPAAGQTDEADLMPYEVLDAIERAAIRDKQSPLEILLVAGVEFPQYSRQQLVVWVERFFRLWCRNQWKRERYAPSFHLDDENLDPKTWCRFPILSGGFERELAELRREK